MFIHSLKEMLKTIHYNFHSQVMVNNHKETKQVFLQLQFLRYF